MSRTLLGIAFRYRWWSSWRVDDRLVCIPHPISTWMYWISRTLSDIICRNRWWSSWRIDDRLVCIPQPISNLLPLTTPISILHQLNHLIHAHSPLQSPPTCESTLLPRTPTTNWTNDVASAPDVISPNSLLQSSPTYESTLPPRLLLGPNNWAAAQNAIYTTLLQSVFLSLIHSPPTY